ncbi:uncharacterized protein LOC121429256 [Lytechinus variegatus]|uniref:uncharacterized protein LOC121429256 n=1 Tax=Lytechinus variegatus TaxID=7654 RepID=UPI001BB16718|nr:uncharacterized protein LOC121429256 [Lytechinus variegatus]
MAGIFDPPEFKCEECGIGDSTQGYKVVEKRHLCQTCARNLASAILADASHRSVKWPCPQHDRKEVELLCPECKEAVCSTCALTSHHGHRMQDIEKKEVVKRDMEKISAKQIERKSFLDKITSHSQELDDHLKDIRGKISVTFQTKSRDQKEQRGVQVARINKKLDELIMNINENRRMQLKEVEEKFHNEQETLAKDRDNVLAELKVVEDNFVKMTSKVKASIEATKDQLESTAALAKSIMVDCDGKAFHEKITEFHEKGMDKLPCFDHDHLDKLSKMVRKIRFKRVDDIQTIGFLEGKKTSYDLVKTVNLPSDVKEPFLLGSIDEQTVVLRNDIGSILYSVKVDSGSLETLMTELKSRGIWDLAVFTLPDNSKGFAYSDFNAGVLKICNRDGTAEKDVGLTLPNDEARTAFVTVDRKGKLLAAGHNTGEIHVINPQTGEHLRTIDNLGCTPINGCGTLSNGDIIVFFENSNICKIFRATGDVRMTLALAGWSRRINFHVGVDDMIYVTYRKESGESCVGYVSVLSPDGVLVKDKAIVFPTSNHHRFYPRCIVPAPGTVIILNGNVLLVYKETPGVDDLQHH